MVPDNELGDLIGVVHCKRTEAVPHWRHQATMATMKYPCPTVEFWESHNFDIGAARSKATEILLSSFPEITYILHVDDDLATGNRNALAGMLYFLKARGEAIISALYYNKFPSQHRCPTCGVAKHDPLIMSIIEKDGRLYFGFPFRGKTPELGVVYEVTAVPAGFLLVKREVFEKLQKPWFVYNDPELLTKFNMDRVGEDMYFSVKARQAGYKLWVDTRAEFIHYSHAWIGRAELVREVEVGDDKPLAMMRAEYFDLLAKSMKSKGAE